MGYLTIQQVSHSFHEQKVLQELDLSIKKGELITLLGPSGCGKSTLLRTIAGLMFPERGTISIDGKEVTKLPSKEREVGMVFQSYALFPNMTVFDNIAFGLKMKKMKRNHIEEKVAKMVQLVGLEGKENAYPRQLSGGQQQRVALARSLVVEPKVLLLDEPLSALDAQIRKSLQIQLRNIQQELNMTTIFVTHDQEEAMTISDRIYIMNGGQIAQAGTPHELYTKPNSEFVARFMGNYNVLTESQLTALFGAHHSWQGTLFAIRPEVISRQKQDGFLAVTGKVVSASVLGNIMGYEAACGDVRLKVEELHSTHGIMQKGDVQEFYMNPKDVITLR
jgi:putative spermidine/putrescine transport system ATP-binding protein